MKKKQTKRDLIADADSAIVPAESSAVTPAESETAELLGEIRSLIDTARERVAGAVNSGMVRLYWHIGQRIQQDILRQERADYGKQVVQALSEILEG